MIATSWFHGTVLTSCGERIVFGDCNAQSRPDAAELIDLSETSVGFRPFRGPDVNHIHSASAMA